MTINYDEDRINFIQLIDVLWSGKLALTFFVVLFGFCGFLYFYLNSAIQVVSVQYSFNLDSVYAEQKCRSDEVCLKKIMDREFSETLGKKWGFKDYNLILKTSKVLPSDQYLAELENFNNTFTSKILKQSKSELSTINWYLDNGVDLSELMSMNLLNAERIIRHLENGQKVVSFGAIRSESKLNEFLVMIVSLVLGLSVGVTYIIVTDALQKHRTKN